VHILSSFSVVVAVARLLENVVLFDTAWLVESAATGKAHPEVARLILLSLKTLLAGRLGFAPLLCAAANFMVFEILYVLDLVFITMRKKRKI
jgi:hypothetical protein